MTVQANGYSNRNDLCLRFNAIPLSEDNEASGVVGENGVRSASDIITPVGCVVDNVRKDYDTRIAQQLHLGRIEVLQARRAHSMMLAGTF
jgi:hypothetical protein